MRIVLLFTLAVWIGWQGVCIDDECFEQPPISPVTMTHQIYLPMMWK